MDSIGGNGNGLAWYSDSNAAITDHVLYQEYSLKQVVAIDVAALKGDIATSTASAEGAPILNYLMWVLKCTVAIA